LERKRPIGVTIIAILTIIGGILLLLGGIALVALAPIISQIDVVDNNDTSNSSITLEINNSNATIQNNALFILGGGFMGMIGGIFIIIGTASFLVAWGLLKGKGWAWIVTIIITIISLVLNTISIIAGSIESIGGLIINGIIIYYLYLPSVKSYFGRIKAPTV
jgi:hypothetical protein